MTSAYKPTDQCLDSMMVFGLAHHASVAIGGFDDLPSRKGFMYQNSAIYSNAVALAHMEARDKGIEGMYTFGGHDSAGDTNNHMWLLQVDGHIISSRYIHAIGRRPRARFGHSLTLLEEQNIIVLYGGCSGDQRLNFCDLFIFIPESITWSEIRLDKGPSLTPVNGGAMCSSKNEIFIFGGMGDKGFTVFHSLKVTLRRDRTEPSELKYKQLCRR